MVMRLLNNGNQIADDVQLIRVLIGYTKSQRCHHVADHFHKIAGKYDELFGMNYSRIADVAIRLLDLQPHDRLVDVGGGTGGVAKFMWTKAGQS